MFLENQSRLDSNMSESHGSASIVGWFYIGNLGVQRRQALIFRGKGLSMAPRCEYLPWDNILEQ
jgi:hypothetical protein